MPAMGLFGIVLRRGVHDVVRADDDDDIRVREVLVDLVHLQHDVVGHLGLRQQHVHVPRQTPRDRVDGEAHLLARRAQLARQLADRLLRLRHRHAVARHDDHAVGLVQRRRHAVGVDCDLLALDRHLPRSHRRSRRE
jgi:hypothetical protein